MQIRPVPGSQLRLQGRELPFGCSGLILLATLAFMAVSVAVFAWWQLTGEVAWVEFVFAAPGALLLAWLSAVQLWASLKVCGEFSPGEPMRAAWQLISVSALFDLAGTLGIQIFGANPTLNPLTHFSWWSTELGASIAAVGHILQGTCRLGLLAAGLFAVLRLYRESGFLGRLRLTDWALLGAFAAYCAREALDLIRSWRAWNPPGWRMVLVWPVDPLLCLLLAEALLLHRSVRRTGNGLVGRCWRTFSAGIFLILLGNVFSWATSYGYLPWPWSSMGWFVWFPAAASFALAPAYQLEAIRWASSGRAGQR